MEAVPAEPSRSNPAWCGSPEPPDKAHGSSWVHARSKDWVGEEAVYLVGSAGDPVPVSRVIDYNGHLKDLLDATYRAQSTMRVLDGLDEHEDADRPLILHFSGHMRPAPVSQVDLVLDNLLLQCKSSHDALGTEWSAPSKILFSGACTAAPLRLLHLSACDSAAPDPAASDVDDEIGARWRALPHYRDWSFAPRTCCGTSTLMPEAVGVAMNGDVIASPVPAMDSLRTSSLHEYMHLLVPFAPITATILDKRFVQDYREGLRRFLGGVLALLYVMVVTLLAALSHLARTPAFLLVMLATARRYGRRGDGDSHLMSAPTWHPIRTRGAACPAA
jgi:hypothetical protein